MNGCIAFRESQVDGSVVYQPFGLKVDAGNGNRRFCSFHARLYREIVLGIAMAVKQKKEKRDRAIDSGGA